MSFHFEVPASQLQDELVAPLYKAGRVMDELRGEFDIVRLGGIADISSGSYIREYIEARSGLPYIRVDNIREYVANLSEDDVARVSPEDPGITDRIVARENDVLLARTGTLGKATIAIGDLVGSVLSQHATRLTVEDTQVDPGYLTWFLNSDYGKAQLIHSGYGSTRKELTHAALKEVEVPILPDSENIGREIRQFVSDYYQSLSVLRRSLAEYEALIGFSDPEFPEFTTFEAPGLDTQLWTPRFYRTEYTSDIERLEREYETRLLGKLCKIQRGKGTRVSDYAEAGIPFARTSSLINFGIDPFPDHYATPETYEEFGQRTEEGDLLVSMEGKIGCVALLSSAEKCVFKNHIEWLRPREDSLPPADIFLYLASGSGQFQMERMTVVQSTIDGLASRLRRVRVPVVEGPEMGAIREQVREATALRGKAFEGLRRIRKELLFRLVEPLAV